MSEEKVAIAKLESRLDNTEKKIDKLEENAGLQRLTKLETVVKENEKDVAKIKDEVNAFYKMAVNQDALTTTLKTLVSDNKEQLSKFGNTLDRVNSNLTNLNNKSDNMQKDLNKFESELENVKDSHQKLVDNGKFDIKNFMFQEAPKYIGLAVIGFLLAYFGLK